jgi:hypothetical protein
MSRKTRKLLTSEETGLLIEDYVNNPSRSLGALAESYGVDPVTASKIVAKHWFGTKQGVIVVLASRMNYSEDEPNPTRGLGESERVYI